MVSTADGVFYSICYPEGNKVNDCYRSFGFFASIR